VLLPSFPGGIIFDLIEVLHSYLLTAGLPRYVPFLRPLNPCHGLDAHATATFVAHRHRIPLYFISPVADQALAYSNICAEWYGFNA
jgi:hypothetical protein